MRRSTRHVPKGVSPVGPLYDIQFDIKAMGEGLMTESTFRFFATVAEGDDTRRAGRNAKLIYDQFISSFADVPEG